MLYEAVKEKLATLLAGASEEGRGLPRYVERDFARYLECGVLAHGFARVRCESCKDELLVAFSCKGEDAEGGQARVHRCTSGQRCRWPAFDVVSGQRTLSIAGPCAPGGAARPVVACQRCSANPVPPRGHRGARRSADRTGEP